MRRALLFRVNQDLGDHSRILDCRDALQCSGAPLTLPRTEDTILPRSRCYKWAAAAVHGARARLGKTAGLFEGMSQKRPPNVPASKNTL